MNLPKQFIKKEKAGIVCGRFSELQEPGKRSPTFTITTIAEVEALAPEKRTAFLKQCYNTKLDEKQKQAYIKAKIGDAPVKSKLKVDVDGKVLPATLKNVLRKYELEILPKHSAETQKLYNRFLGYWCEHLGHLPIDQITPGQVRMYRDKYRLYNMENQSSRSTVSCKDSTLNRVVTALNSVYAQ